MDIVTLLKRLKNKEEEAFKELVFAFSNRLMTISKIYCRDKNDAQDILQEAFFRVYKKIDSFQGDQERALFAWVKKIVINLALSKNQKKYLSMEQGLDAVEYSQSIDPKVLAQLSHDEIMDLVFKLPDGYRQVFALFAIDGYSHKEIAEKLNIAESTSRSQYMRSRKLLQKQVNNLYKVLTA